MTLCTIALGLGSCSSGARRAEVPPDPNPLPKLVTGANLRTVGDRRRGYGTATAQSTMRRLSKLGVNTIAVLIEGRLSSASDHQVRGPTRQMIDDATRALDDARAQGFATVLVPHLYVDDGTWRGDLAHADDDRWWETYEDFIGSTAAVAELTGTTALSVGLELKAMSTHPAATARMARLVERVRRTFRGQLIYTANWDEAESVLWWPLVDLVGVNGYYPLLPTPDRGAEKVARQLSELSEKAAKEVMVVEVGFRSSPLSHVRPWEWPEQLDPVINESAQAQAWAAVLTHWLAAPGVRGLLLWVVPTDPDDPASEPRHGFNPLNKQAEKIIEEGFRRAHARTVEGEP